MTHSLHRQGTPESLKNDWVVLVTPAANINHENSADKLREIITYAESLGVSNIGGYETGSIHHGFTFDQIRQGLDKSRVPRLRFCMSDRDKVEKIVRFLVEKNYGISVVISGLIDEIHDMCRNVGIKPHSVNLSLGFWGKTELLPEARVMEMVTMCGHGMISPNLVRWLIEEVKSGHKSPWEAAVELSKPCVCGIFNTERARDFFEKVKNEQ